MQHFETIGQEKKLEQSDVSAFLATIDHVISDPAKLTPYLESIAGGTAALELQKNLRDRLIELIAAEHGVDLTAYVDSLDDLDGTWSTRRVKLIDAVNKALRPLSPNGTEPERPVGKTKLQRQGERMRRRGTTTVEDGLPTGDR